MIKLFPILQEIKLNLPYCITPKGIQYRKLSSQIGAKKLRDMGFWFRDKLTKDEIVRNWEIWGYIDNMLEFELEWQIEHGYLKH